MKCCAVRMCTKRDLFVVSSLIGLVSECPRFGRPAGQSVRNKDDITNKERRKKLQPKGGTFTGRNHERINVAGIHLISGFIFGYDVK